MTNIKRLLTLLALALIGSAALADPIAPETAPQVATAHAEAFIVPLPEVSTNELLQALHQQRAALETQREDQRGTVERNRMTVGKTLLAIVAPGGLLIAAGMQAVKASAEQQVAALDTRIDDLSADLRLVQHIVVEQSFMLAANSHGGN